MENRSSAADLPGCRYPAPATWPIQYPVAADGHELTSVEPWPSLERALAAAAEHRPSDAAARLHRRREPQRRQCSGSDAPCMGAPFRRTRRHARTHARTYGRGWAPEPVHGFAVASGSGLPPLGGTDKQFASGVLGFTALFVCLVRFGRRPVVLDGLVEPVRSEHGQPGERAEGRQQATRAGAGHGTRPQGET